LVKGDVFRTKLSELKHVFNEAHHWFAIFYFYRLQHFDDFDWFLFSQLNVKPIFNSARLHNIKPGMCNFDH